MKRRQSLSKKQEINYVRVGAPTEPKMQEINYVRVGAPTEPKMQTFEVVYLPSNEASTKRDKALRRAELLTKHEKTIEHAFAVAAESINNVLRDAGIDDAEAQKVMREIVSDYLRTVHR